MNQKKIVRLLIILLIVLLTGIVLIHVNRDIFQYQFDIRLDRSFVPERDSHRDYILWGPITLKPGSYELSFVMTVEGRGSGVYMIDGDDVTRVIGTGVKPTVEDYETSLVGGPSTANVGNVGAIYIAPSGNLYYTDYLTFTVMKVVPDADGNYANGTISIVAGIPFSAAVVNGATDKATFKYPSGIVVSDDEKRIFVSEPTGYVLRMIDLS